MKISEKDLDKMFNPKNSARAVLIDGYMTYVVPIESLKIIAEYVDVVVSDPKLFARELVLQLNKEEEDGTTVLHRYFDKAITAASENGAEGCELVDIEHIYDEEC